MKSTNATPKPTGPSTKKHRRGRKQLRTNPLPACLNSRMELKAKSARKSYSLNGAFPYLLRVVVWASCFPKACSDRNKSFASLFELTHGTESKVRTEIIFLERCLSLLAPGGRLGIVLPEGVFNNPSRQYVRDFCEDRAFLRAVVSLPGETFSSSGADVKASLLFLQKYTDEEKQRFESTRARVRDEIGRKYAPVIERETARLQAEIDAARASKDANRRAAARQTLKEFVKRMDDLKRDEARQLLKARFDYPIFVYDAQSVGITATGEPDANELYPNPNPPADSAKNCLDLYQEFRRDPAAFNV